MHPSFSYRGVALTCIMVGLLETFGAGSSQAVAGPAAPIPTSHIATISDAQNAYIIGLYTGLLGRLPDSGGLSFWQSQVGAGIGCRDLAVEFLNSNEFHNAQAQLSHSEFVSRLYVGLLNRAPDSVGLNWWTSQIYNGVSRATVVGQFFVTRDVPSVAGNGFDTNCQNHGFKGTGSGSGATMLTDFPLESGVPPAQPNSVRSEDWIWVFRSDNSLSQYPDGSSPTTGCAKPSSISLDADRNVLENAGVKVLEAAKQIKTDLDFTLPIPDEAALRAGDSPLTPANLCPSIALPSGIVNSYRVSVSDLAIAANNGFLVMIDPGKFLAARDCSKGDAFIAFGQSNSANSGDVKAAETALDSNALMFFNGHCYPARDPILGASIWDGGSSVWKKFARVYAAQNPGRIPIIVAMGVGSSSSADWTSVGVWSNRLRSVLGQARAANLNVKKIFYHQGEQDSLFETVYGPSNIYDNYIHNFNDILATVRGYFPNAQMAIAIGSYLGSLPFRVSREVENAQIDLILNNYPHVQLGVVADQYPIQYHVTGLNSDDVHYNGEGLARISNEWYQNTMVGQNQELLMLSALIRTYFGRLPRSNEVADLAKLGSLAAARKYIQDSDEYFVRELYRKFAHRLPERGGYEYWMQTLSTGTRDQIMNSFKGAATLVGPLAPVPPGFQLMRYGMNTSGGFYYWAPLFNPKNPTAGGPYYFSESSGLWELNQDKMY